ncbi:MAG: THUMP domain-containing protein [Candidatus Woesearchaeota archaeon]
MKAEIVSGAVITKRGIEDISAIEIKEIINSEPKKNKCVLHFKSSRKGLCDLCYYGRSFTRVIELFGSFDFRNIDDIKNKLLKSEVKNFKAESFAARCIKESSNISSLDIEKIFGEYFNKKFKVRVNLENPQKTILIFVFENQLYFGLDYAGFDLNKRDYRIFLHPAAIRGDVAYSMLRMADYRPTDVLLDPFCGSGTIAIEAALFAINRAVHFYNRNKFSFLKFINYKFEEKEKDIKIKIFAYDALAHNIKSAEKNAKIAGVNKKITFSRTEVEWLDTKFKEKSVDKIVTNAPRITENNIKNIAKTFSEFFNNAAYILKKNGLIVIMTNDPLFTKEKAKVENFICLKEITLNSLNILVFAQQ